MDNQLKRDKIRQSTNKYSSVYIEAVQKMTPREFDVLKGVSTGRTSQEIGEQLNISHRTIQKHRENICKKLDLEGYRALFNWCLKHIKGGGEYDTRNILCGMCVLSSG